jgi:hypothetical protein
MIEEKNINLDVLAQNKLLSYDVVEVCERNEILDFRSLLAFYNERNGNLSLLKNASLNDKQELTSFCLSYINFPIDESIDKIEYYVSLMNLLNSTNKATKKIVDIQIKNLISKLSNRGGNALKKYFKGVPNFNKIVSKIYAPHFNFLDIRNVGLGTLDELVQFKKDLEEIIKITKQINNKSEDEILDNKEQIPNEPTFIFNSLNKEKKQALYKLIDIKFSILDTIDKDFIFTIVGYNKTKNEFSNKLLHHIFLSTSFKFIEEISSPYFNLFKSTIKDFAYQLQSIDNENLEFETNKMIISSSFPDIFKYSENVFDEIFTGNKKIRLFKLIHILVNGEFFFTKNASIYLSFYFSVENQKRKKEIIKRNNNLPYKEIISKHELLNRIKAVLDFILFFSIDEFDLSYLDFSKELFVVLNSKLTDTLNIQQKLNFNAAFYVNVLDILFKEKHLILGLKGESLKSSKLSIKYNSFKNYYIIHDSLVTEFDFNKFLIETNVLFKKKVYKGKEENFENYLQQYLINKETIYYDRIKEICRIIFLDEFGINIYETDNIFLKHKKLKSFEVYVVRILEEKSEPMTLSEIDSKIKENYPNIQVSKVSLRSCITKEKNLLIYYGRSSTYGLRKWEEEKENHKGGTIRKIVKEYLEKFDEPKHISEIVEHVKIYRKDTYARSISGNLSIGLKHLYMYYGGGFIGLKTKKYNGFNPKIKQIAGGLFEKVILKNMIGWDISAIQKHCEEKYGYRPIQIMNLINKKVNKNIVRISDDNKLMLPVKK